MLLCCCCVTLPIARECVCVCLRGLLLVRRWVVVCVHVDELDVLMVQMFCCFGVALGRCFVGVLMCCNVRLRVTLFAC